jgi:hypothetical protein
MVWTNSAGFALDSCPAQMFGLTFVRRVYSLAAIFLLFNMLLVSGNVFLGAGGIVVAGWLGFGPWTTRVKDDGSPFAVGGGLGCSCNAIFWLALRMLGMFGCFALCIVRGAMAAPTVMILALLASVDMRWWPEAAVPQSSPVPDTVLPVSPDVPFVSPVRKRQPIQTHADDVKWNDVAMKASPATATRALFTTTSPRNVARN